MHIQKLCPWPGMTLSQYPCQRSAACQYSIQALMVPYIVLDGEEGLEGFKVLEGSPPPPSQT